ncbi:MAG: hypothetical protein JNK07_00370 [Alphaproteobacteria bacterium]|nr:hypothetical protein [Alphaproteobacteria bacterium]
MKSKLLSRTLMAATVAGLMGLSFMAGSAQSAGPETVAKLNQTVDLLTKAQAVLGASGTNRQGYAHVEKAKADVASALKEIDKAVKANGG